MHFSRPSPRKATDVVDDETVMNEAYSSDPAWSDVHPNEANLVPHEEPDLLDAD